MDVTELEENLFAASDAKLHRDMCKELSAVYCKVLSIFPSLEEARPRSKSGIQALCSLHIALEKAKNILQHCSECSKLYLAITGDAVLLKFEKTKSALIDSLRRVEDIVPSSIGSQILDIIGELEHTKFLLDPSEKEVGDRIIALLQQGKKFDNGSDNAELEIFHQAATRLSITSSRSALAERRALKKLIDRARVEEDKRKESIVAYLLHLMRKYSKLFRSEIVDENDSQGSTPCSPTGQGSNEDRAPAFGRQLSKFGSINYKPMNSSTLGTVDHMQPQDFEKVVSPASVAHFSQYKLTSLMLKRLEDLGFSVRSSKEPDGLELDSVVAGQILMGHECVAIDANKESVTATVSVLEGGKYMKRDIQCSILVGADGAGSAVRRLTNIEMRGERDLQKLISVHFMSRELGEYLINSRPGMLFFIFNTGGIGVLVAHDLLQGEFVLQIPYYPPQQSLSDFSSEMCKMLIFNLVGHEVSDLDVADIKPWVMHAEVAEKFMCCENRVILAGDAAHRFPPAGGFGMNTGIQDAHNLAWKIAALVQGSAKSSILDTYETERRPVALFNTSLSIQNFRAAMSVPSALGLDPRVANSVHRFINKTVGNILPTGLQKAILDNVFALGRAQLSESLLNETNPLGHQRLSRLKSIFEEGKSLQLQFPAEDLGFRYLEGAIVPDNESEAVGPKVPSGRRRDYVPCAGPGSRLPHMYVRILSDSTREVLSTLDLVSTEKVEFLLIISPLQESYELARATFKAAKELMANVKVCVVWPCSDDGVQRESKSALAPWENYVDVMEVKKQSGEEASWWSICKMSERGSILVRPDQHIAWRVKCGVTLDPTLHMRDVFTIILGKQ